MVGPIHASIMKSVLGTVGSYQQGKNVTVFKLPALRYHVLY